MLAEKFILYLEALIKDRSYETPTYSDGAPRATSSSPHAPIHLPIRSNRPGASHRSANYLSCVWFENKIAIDDHSHRKSPA